MSKKKKNNQPQKTPKPKKNTQKSGFAEGASQAVRQPPAGTDFHRAPETPPPPHRLLTADPPHPHHRGPGAAFPPSGRVLAVPPARVGAEER